MTTRLNAQAPPNKPLVHDGAQAPRFARHGAPQHTRESLDRAISSKEFS